MNDSFTEFINKIKTIISEQNTQNLLAFLNGSKQFLEDNVIFIDELFEEMQPIETHTLVHLFAHLIKFECNSWHGDDVERVCQYLHEFIECSRAFELHLAKHDFFKLIQLFSDYMVEQRDCMPAIPIVAAALDKIRLDKNQLTPIHASLCLLCLKSRNFSIIFKYLDADINSIVSAPEVGAKDAKDPKVPAPYCAGKCYLLYFYYGGVIYAVFKKYDRALFFFKACLATPTNAISHIMAEAYKKFILVSLIHHGKVTELPKHSSPLALRTIKSLIAVYYDVVDAYASLNVDELKAAIDFHKDTLIRDSNFQLAKQVVVSVYKRRVIDLTNVFIELSLTDIARRIRLPDACEVEPFILSMIKNSEIRAKIDQKNGYVVFNNDDDDVFNGIDSLNQVEHETLNITDRLKIFEQFTDDVDAAIAALAKKN